MCGLTGVQIGLSFLAHQACREPPPWTSITTSCSGSISGCGRSENSRTSLHDDFSAGLIPGFVHLYAGEEAIAVGVCAHLDDDDYITSTHRGHGHCIAKGVEINEMMAEIRGKAAGCCKGKGGSMHIADVDRGMLGANGIVGGGPPLACGAALSSRIQGNRQATVCFFGDGGSNQGTTAESLNLAAVWKLPVVFVCENNRYAETTSTDYSIGGPDIAGRGTAFGMPGIVVDGQDVFAVYEAAGEALKRARDGQGPTLLECQTYRYFGHFEGDELKYRTRDEEGSLSRARLPGTIPLGRPRRQPARSRRTRCYRP